MLRGYAERSEHRLWNAEFEIGPAAPGVDVTRLDYPALLRTAPDSDMAAALPIALRRFTVDLQGGAVVLDVEGSDRVGFLADLLNVLAGLSLFPEEMTIETRNGWADDRFVLRGVGGQRPSGHARRALVALLEALIVHP